MVEHKDMSEIKVISLFDGMSCGQIALERLGFKPQYFASEVDKYAIQVTQKNYPNTVQMGDVRNIHGGLFGDVGLVIAGSPCQGFSNAGKGLNFKDPRSALFFEFVRILRQAKPKYFLLENVRMKKEWQNIISLYLGVEPIRINSNLLSAQNRDRFYWTNIPFEGDLTDRGITWGNIRECSNCKNEHLYYSDKAIKWIQRHGLRKNKTLKIHKNDEKMQMVEASHFKNYSSQRFFGIVDRPIINTSSILPVCKTLPVLKTNEALRYVSPVECERLQTVPDNYTDNVSNTQRYKMLGNGMTVDVIVELLRGMKP